MFTAPQRCSKLTNLYRTLMIIGVHLHCTINTLNPAHPIIFRVIYPFYDQFTSKKATVGLLSTFFALLFVLGLFLSQCFWFQWPSDATEKQTPWVECWLNGPPPSPPLPGQRQSGGRRGLQGSDISHNISCAYRESGC